MPHNSWSSPDPCTYEKPFDRLSKPSPTCFDADTHMVGKNVRSLAGGNRGNVDVAGVIHIGRSEQWRSGRSYDDSFGNAVRRLKQASKLDTHVEMTCPFVQSSVYLRVFLSTDSPRRCVQLRILTVVLLERQLDCPIDHSAPDRHRLRQRVRHALARSC